jgi:hypothetical protein
LEAEAKKLLWKKNKRPAQASLFQSEWRSNGKYYCIDRVTGIMKASYRTDLHRFQYDFVRVVILSPRLTNTYEKCQAPVLVKA